MGAFDSQRSDGRYQDDRVSMYYDQLGRTGATLSSIHGEPRRNQVLVVSWMLWRMCFEWILFSVLWMLLVQILRYQGMDDLGQWGECGAVRGGGTRSAMNAIPACENNAQVESEPMIYDRREILSHSNEEEGVDCKSGTHDESDSEQVLSESLFDKSYQ